MRTIKYILGLVVVFLVAVTKAQTNFDWVGHNEGIVIVESMTTDINGNTLIVGTFQNTVDFDPGSGVQSIPSVGSNDIFVQKIDVNGNLLWVHTFGSTSTDEGQDVEVDVIGNVYITGNFRNVIDFDPGPGNASFGSFGNDDVFVLKLDPNGNYVWVKTIGSIDEEESYAVAVDNFGNVYASGVITSSAVDMDPGPGVFTLTPSGTISSFVVKFKQNGDFIWAKQFRGSSSVFPEDMAIDNNNELLWTGHFQNSVDFDPNAGVTNLSSNGLRDIPIVKLDTAGSLVWARNIGGTSSDEGHSIMANSNNDVVLCGQFRNTVDFDPGVGVANLVSGGSEDWFVLKLTSAGNYSWAISGGLNGSDESYGLDIDNSDNIYIAGKFSGNVDFNPQAGAFLINSNGGWDGFVQILDNNGFFVDAFSIGGTGSEDCKDVSIGTFNSIHVSGRFGSVTDFDPGVGTVNLTPISTADGYILRLNQCSNTTSTINPSACTSYTSPSGKFFTTSNTYTDTIQNARGCDSIITINLTINNTATGTDVITACNSYTWIDNNTYTANNTSATHTLVGGNSVGCDSVVTLNLTINNATAGTDVQTACGSYTWIDNNTYTASNTTATHTLVGGNSVGCDSVITLNLTINNATTSTDVQTACGSYTWIDNNTYTTSNTTATHTLVGGNSVGCDSVVTLNLTINNATTSTDVQTACGSYTWIDNNTYIANNTTASHTIIGGNSVGCDSVVTLNLTINNATAGTDVQTACGSYTWIDNNTYTSNNSTATHTLVAGNSVGCDSVITLNLTINNATTSTDIQTACDSYTWIDNNTYTASNTTATHTLVGGNSVGCDSIVTLNLTINNATAGTDVQTACGSYTWIDNNTYTSSNTTATHTLVSGNSVGCDSVVTLNLTINTVDNTTSTQGNDSISASAIGATYQWLDCENSFAIISGATNQLFVASTNGNYAVQVTQNGCTDTSACVQVIGVGVDEENSENAILVYPNPNNGLFTVKMMSNKNQTVDLCIINITGETIGSWKLKNKLTIDLSNYAKGIYFLQLVTEKGKATKKIIVQ